MIELDGSNGEDGGQILRTALFLSLLSGTSFRIHNIRSGRPKPVLKTQHLLGRLGVPSEKIGKSAYKHLLEELEAGTPVDRHLGDNLVPWLGIQTGEIRVSEIGPHVRTNLWVYEQFLEVEYGVEGPVIRSSPL